MGARTSKKSLVERKKAKHINELPVEVLTKILSNLPQNNLVLCREVCQKWRDTIDQHCPMKETIRLEEDDKFLSRKLNLRMTTCELDYFQKTTPNISLTHPQTIKSFIFGDQLHPFFGNDDKEDLNVENARGILLQIAPFVELLQFTPIYLRNNILPGVCPFPKLRSLGHSDVLGMNAMPNNLGSLFSRQFPLLENLQFYLDYKNNTLRNEACGHFLNCLANHRHNLKRLVAYIFYKDFGVEFDLSKEVKRDLYDGQLQLESLQLLLPPKYIPFWAPIIASQKKLTFLAVGNIKNCIGVGCFPFDVISSAILSSACTLRMVILFGITSVTSDGMGWIPLDLSVFRDVVNLTELFLIKSNSSNTVPQPNENEGAWITNLHEINATSLKELTIDGFVCNSGELQILVDNSPVLESLQLFSVLAPETSEKYAESGVHGGIIKSFVEKKSSKGLRYCDSLNLEDAEQNEKLVALMELIPHRVDNEGFDGSFP